MSEENNAEATVDGMPPIEEIKPKPNSISKPKATSRQPKKAEGKAKITSGVAGKPARPGVKFSADEKVEALKRIESLILEDKRTLKDAIKEVGIAEQTYYNWKKALAPVVDTAVKANAAAMPNAKAAPKLEPKLEHQNDDLADLVALEAENARLRKLLAARLRSENVELRKRLGLDY